MTKVRVAARTPSDTLWGMRRLAAHLLLPVFALAGLAACGSDDDSSSEATTAAPAAAATPGAQAQLVSPAEADGLMADPPAGLVVLDIRTPEEFGAGHIAGATNLDFYAASFAADLAELDRGVPYLVYCHTGNRSGMATQAMQQLGFTTVYDIAGGIDAWQAAGFPITV